MTVYTLCEVPPQRKRDLQSEVVLGGHILWLTTLSFIASWGSRRRHIDRLRDRVLRRPRRIERCVACWNLDVCAIQE